jgi:mannose-6-phosphate isomerase-like protein (cupin superfamily)
MTGNVLSGDNTEFWIRERCYIRELVNSASIGAFSLAEARVEPGIRTERHRLTVDEWYVITAGQGSVVVGDDEPVPVAPGDVVQIPAGTPQHIENTGSKDLVFECICLPRFTPDCYEAVENV